VLRVWFFGRTAAEYFKMFKLDSEDLRGNILDCNAGASLFTAQMREKGFYVKAVDKLYDKSLEELVRIAKKSLYRLIRSHGKFMDEKWGAFKDELLKARIKGFKIS